MLTKFQLILLPVALVFAEVPSKRCIVHGCDIKKISTGGKRSCYPGEVWFKDCSKCVCLGFGHEICTEYDCQRNNWVYEKLRKRRQIGNKAERTCTPGTSWKEECNTCFCSETGHVGCTLMACTSHQYRPKRESTCTPGTSWKEDCNTCFCSANGEVGCTLKACTSYQNRERKCTPGTSWEDGCNTCFCSANGQVGCTMIECTSYEYRSKRESKCTPGTSWKEDCNTCFCSETGEVACTKKGCNSHNIVRRSEERTCTPGTSWKEDCNTCFCSETGHVGCTLMGCTSHQFRQKRVIVAVSARNNWCQKWDTRYPLLCSRKKAEEVQSEVSLQELEKNCEIGTTIKLECNICYCTAIGFACTKRLCHGHEVSVVVEE